LIVINELSNKDYNMTPGVTQPLSSTQDSLGVGGGLRVEGKAMFISISQMLREDLSRGI